MVLEKEPQGKYVKVGDLKLHYHEFGSGVIKAESIFQPMPLEGIRNIAN